MTMHLVGPYLTTTNYKKRKQKKITQKQLEKYTLELRAYNKRMRQIQAREMSLDEYIDYCHGKYTPAKEKKEFKPYVPPASYRRETPRIPSLNDGKDMTPCLKKEPQRYTGTLIKGIATMHKSNAIPIINEAQAIEVAQMRRS